MLGTVLTCSRCAAPLKPPSRFARTVACEFCGATTRLDPTSVSVERFRRAHAAWSAAGQDGMSDTLPSGRWVRLQQLGAGEISDVYLVRRARLPSDLGVLRVLRSPDDEDIFERAWAALSRLERELPPDRRRWLPHPLWRGTASSGSADQRRLQLFAHPAGFVHTALSIQARRPQGVSAEVGVWVFRRILEALAALHAVGVVHGALLPHHVLLPDDQHEVHLVGFGCAGAVGEPLAVLAARDERFYQNLEPALSPALDVALGARTVIALLGGAGGKLPPTVPGPLSALLDSAASGAEPSASALWSRVGETSLRVLGAPSFHPLRLL